MVGSRVEVAGELPGDLGRAAVGDQRVDQCIAAATAEVILTPAQPAQVAGVVDQAEIRARTLARPRARARPGSVSSTTLCSGASSGPGPSTARASAGVLGRDEIRDGARRRGPWPGRAPSGPGRPAPGGRAGRPRPRAHPRSGRASGTAGRTAGWPRGDPRPRQAGTGRGGAAARGRYEPRHQSSAWSFHMFTMLVASVSVVVASRSSSAWTRSPAGELPSHSAPKPSRSMPDGDLRRHQARTAPDPESAQSPRVPSYGHMLVTVRRGGEGGAAGSPSPAAGWCPARRCCRRARPGRRPAAAGPARAGCGTSGAAGPACPACCWRWRPGRSARAGSTWPLTSAQMLVWSNTRWDT